MTPDKWSKDYDYRPQREWRKPRIVRTPSELRTRFVVWALVLAFAAAFWWFVVRILPVISKALEATP